MKVTAAQLEGWYACGEQVTTFRSEWGESVTLTRAVLLRAAELGLDLEWWLGRTRPDLVTEYEKVTAPAWAEYQKVTAPALADLLELQND